MLTAVKNRGTLALLGLLCTLAAARADEIQFVPDRPHIVMSFNYQTFLKSKVLAEVKKLLPVGDEVDAKMADNIGVPGSNIARLTMSIAFTEKERKPDEVMILTTVKPVTAADIKTAKKPRKYQKNHSFKDMKVGKYILNQEHFQFQFNENDKPGPEEAGQSLCVVDANTVVIGQFRQLDAIKKVLERDKAPQLSDTMKDGMKQASFANALSMVLDIANMPAREKAEMVRDIPAPGLKDIIDSVQLLTIKANESDKVTATATATCKDAASATKLKKVADDGLTAIQAFIKLKGNDEKLPAQIKELIGEVTKGLAAIKISTKDTQVQAEVSLEPAAVASIFKLMLVPVARSSEKSGPSVKEKAK